MVDSGWTIPRCIEVIFHVCVIRKQLAVMIERCIKDIPEAIGIGLERFAFGVYFVNDSTGGKPPSIVTFPIRHTRQQVILAPDLWNL